MRERPRPEFVSKNEASRMLGISPSTFGRLAEMGAFATLELDGLPPRYRAADIEAYRARRTKPASALAVSS